MAKRVQAVCQALVDDYDGRAENLWRDVASADELLARLKALPGFGDEKSRIFIAILGKRFGEAPPGWQEAAGPFGDDVPRSVADVARRREPRQGPRVEEGEEGGGQDQAGLSRSRSTL